MASVLEKRLIFVTGKGGVGKSTVAAALGVVAARRGKRTLICEVSQQERVSRMFEHEGVGYEETEIAPDLYAFSIDPQRALEEYLLMQIKLRPLYDLMFKNRIFTYFAAATPGLREMVTIGKVWELARLDRRARKGDRYDVVIVDSPATGHGIGLLRTPKTFGDIARVGPIKRQAETIYDFITDRRQTGVCAVAWPEEMPVNETLDLQRRLASELHMKIDTVIMNGLYPNLFSQNEAATVRARYDEIASAGKPDALEVMRRAALRAAISEHARASSHREQLQRLEQSIGQDVVELPFLFERRFDMAAVGRLADRIEEAL
jgi:anion-transporting  ArsA/GET3 family ATPase